MKYLWDFWKIWSEQSKGSDSKDQTYVGRQGAKQLYENTKDQTLSLRRNVDSISSLVGRLHCIQPRMPTIDCIAYSLVTPPDIMYMLNKAHALTCMVLGPI